MLPPPRTLALVAALATAALLLAVPLRAAPAPAPAHAAHARVHNRARARWPHRHVSSNPGRPAAAAAADEVRRPLFDDVAALGGAEAIGDEAGGGEAVPSGKGTGPDRAKTVAEVAEWGWEGPVPSVRPQAFWMGRKARKTRKGRRDALHARLER